MTLDLNDREKAAIIGGLQLLSGHAWSEKLYNEPVEVADILDAATECSRHEMMKPEEIQELCNKVAAI